MSEIEQGVVARVTQDYRPVLRRFLPRRSEDARAAAYELGRSAVALGVPMIEMCRVHQEVAAEVLDESSPQDAETVREAADELLLEVLAAYDMTHRGALGR